MADRGELVRGEFSIFQGIHVRFDIRINISIFIRYDHQIWKVGTSTGLDLYETN